MPPPIHTFPSSSLLAEVQKNTEGKKRKPAPGAPAKIDLRECELLSMSQYDCDVGNTDDPTRPIYCAEVLKFFRRCADRKGSFMVETTTWENLERDKKLASKS